MGRCAGTWSSCTSWRQRAEISLQNIHSRIWRRAATDRLRDRFGESAVSLAAGLRGSFRERTHENPAGLPGKGKHK